MGNYLRSLQSSSRMSLGALLSLFTVLLSSQNSFASTNLLSFQLGALEALQTPGTANSFSGLLTWSPEFSLTDSLAVRGQFGGSLLAAAPSGTFVMLTYQALLEYGITSSLLIDAGGGYQTWLNNGGSAPVGTGAVAFRPAGKIFGLIERIFAQYSYFALSLATTHEIVVGVGFQF